MSSSLCLRTSRSAPQSTSASFASSAGCRLKPIGSGIHDVAPLTDLPMNSTATSSASETMSSG
jgi:hypothetical protein